jgi:hypothetical protein
VFQEAVVPLLISLPRLSCLLILVFQEAVVPLLISLPRLTSLTLEKAGAASLYLNAVNFLKTVNLVMFLIKAKFLSP